ncbi:MAG: hypothetical protein ACYS8W_21635 [Planctomycetota bacterium]|jgi:hypothetical protein
MKRIEILFLVLCTVFPGCSSAAKLDIPGMPEMPASAPAIPGFLSAPADAPVAEGGDAGAVQFIPYRGFIHAYAGQKKVDDNIWNDGHWQSGGIFGTAYIPNTSFAVDGGLLLTSSSEKMILGGMYFEDAAIYLEEFKFGFRYMPCVNPYFFPFIRGGATLGIAGYTSELSHPSIPMEYPDYIDSKGIAGLDIGAGINI